MNAHRYMNKKGREVTGQSHLENGQKVKSKLKTLEKIVKNSYKKELTRTLKHQIEYMDTKKKMSLKKEGPKPSMGVKI